MGLGRKYMGDWEEDKRHGFGSLAILDAQEIRKEERRRIERMMRRCLTWFPIGGLGNLRLYQNMWCFTRIGDFTWRVSDL